MAMTIESMWLRAISVVSSILPMALPHFSRGMATILSTIPCEGDFQAVGVRSLDMQPIQRGVDQGAGEKRNKNAIGCLEPIRLDYNGGARFAIIALC
jgi:hypothetical protein